MLFSTTQVASAAVIAAISTASSVATVAPTTVPLPPSFESTFTALSSSIVVTTDLQTWPEASPHARISLSAPHPIECILANTSSRSRRFLMKTVVFWPGTRAWTRIFPIVQPKTRLASTEDGRLRLPHAFPPTVSGSCLRSRGTQLCLFCQSK